MESRSIGQRKNAVDISYVLWETAAKSPKYFSKQIEQSSLAIVLSMYQTGSNKNHLNFLLVLIFIKLF